MVCAKEKYSCCYLHACRGGSHAVHDRGGSHAVHDRGGSHAVHVGESHMQCMIRSSNLQRIHCTLSAHAVHGYQHITKYTQSTTTTTNTSLSTLNIQPCMQTHTKSTQHATMHGYQLYMYMYSSIRDSSNNNIWLKSLRVDHNSCNTNPHKMTKT